MRVSYNPLTNAFEDSPNECLLPQIMWHITDSCYLKCKTCFVRMRKLSGARRESGDMVKNLLLLKRLGVQKIDLSGGEPLLYKGLPDLVESTQKEGFYLTITTRGIGLSENREWICNNWMKFSRIILSLDGGEAKTCDFYSGYSGTFRNTVDFWHQLKSSGCDRIRINTVVNQSILNLAEHKALLDLICKLTPQEWCIIEPHPMNKTDEFEQYAVTSKEYEDFLNSTLSEVKKEDIKVLQRRKELYSTYWALYPDNMICGLSEYEHSFFEMELSEANYKTIVHILEKATQLLPGESERKGYGQTEN